MKNLVKIINTNTDSVSIVIPAWNAERTLWEAVKSVYDGNFDSGDEIIIVDDASTDNTPNVINKIKKRYPAVQSLRNETNLGCPASRNRGVALARNELIFNLDADNVLAPQSLTPLKQHLIKTGASITAFSEIRYFQKTPRLIKRIWIFPYDEMLLADILAGHISPAPAGNFMYRKQIWKKVGGYFEYGPGLHEAWGFSLKMLSYGAKFTVLPHSFYFHRYGHESLFSRESKKPKESSTLATKMLQPFFGLIDEKDVAYITLDGADDWFENLDIRPIRLKNGNIGRTGISERMPTKLWQRLYIRIVRKFNRIKKIINSLTHYHKTFFEFKKQCSQNKRDMPIRWRDRHMILDENTTETKFDAHYVYHPAWAVRIIAKEKPEQHTDISSTLYFGTMLSAFVPVKFFDYRPAHVKLSGFHSASADVTNLPFTTNSVSSLSCMHTVEHIGLGRYGDPLDQDGDLKAIAELKRVLAPGGNLLFVTPVGKPRVVFNAHRIYSYDQIIEYFNGLELKEFSLVPDNGQKIGLIENAGSALANRQSYGCGCFWFKKPRTL